MGAVKVHRPWLWNDVKTPTGYITPIGFVSKETIRFFSRPYFRVTKNDDGETSTLTLVRPSDE